MSKHQPKITQFFSGDDKVNRVEGSKGEGQVLDLVSQSSSFGNSLSNLENASLLENTESKNLVAALEGLHSREYDDESVSLQNLFKVQTSKRQKRSQTLYTQKCYRRGRGTLLKSLLNRELRQEGSHHLLERWTLAYRVMRSPHSEWISGYNETGDDPVYGPLTLVRPRTTGCLQFESSGQVLAASNDKNEILIYDFTEYRAFVRSSDVAHNLFDTWNSRPDVSEPILSDDGFQAAFGFKTTKQAGNLLWDSRNEDVIGASFEEKREICMYNVRTESAGDVFHSTHAASGSKGNSTFAYIPERGLVVAGGLDGCVRAWDTRYRQRESWVYQNPSQSAVTSIVSMSRDRLIVSYANGLLTELDLAAGIKRSQAFGVTDSPHAKYQITVQRLLGKRFGSSNAPGIHAMARDMNHPTRLAILATNGAVILIDAMSWKVHSYETQHVMRSGRQDESGYHPNYRNCFAFAAGNNGESLLYNVRKSDECFIDVYDFELRTARGESATIPVQSGTLATNSELTTVDSGEVVKQWGSSSPGMGVRPHPLQLDLRKKISAIAVHPSSGAIVTAHYRDPRLRVLGLI